MDANLYELTTIMILIVIGYILINYFVVREKMFNIPMRPWLSKIYKFNDQYKLLYWITTSFFVISFITQVADSNHTYTIEDLLSPSMFITISLILISILSAIFCIIKRKNHFISYALMTVAIMFMSITGRINNSYYFDVEYVFIILTILKIADLLFDIKIKKDKAAIEKGPYSS